MPEPELELAIALQVKIAEGGCHFTSFCHQKQIFRNDIGVGVGIGVGFVIDFGVTSKFFDLELILSRGRLVCGRG